MGRVVWATKRPGESPLNQSAVRTAPAYIECAASESFQAWIARAGGSVVPSTYQSGKIQSGKVALATHYNLRLLGNAPLLPPGYLGGFCFVGPYSLVGLRKTREKQAAHRAMDNSDSPNYPLIHDRLPVTLDGRSQVAPFTAEQHGYRPSIEGKLLPDSGN